MKNRLSTGALLVSLSGFVAGCAVLPGVSEPELGAAHSAHSAAESVEVGEILFDSEAAALPDEAHRTVRRAVLYLMDNPDSHVIVEGHTDEVGPESTNQMLSEMRAGTIVRALRAGGVSKDRITAIGYGETKPVADNSTAAGRRANRRVEFIFSDAIQQ